MNMVYWHWLILGGIFLILEISSFTTFFLFFSISAFILAAITGIFPNIDINWQLFIATILAIISTFSWYYVYKNNRINKNKTDVNNRLKQYIGNDITLEENSFNGISKVKIGDTLWRVKIPSGKKGEIVKITGVRSTTFLATKK